ncbi:uncharacterized protein N7515_007038 [Penicillium bovifimosum]|uniref:Uncharacterized protein n=1 Tax=Penicillium bovifimosum TaxID=126998 RepID=A0A9W9L1B1_9EURO|nr:uncharacterized protein N7515_007038 [Penicillium bovifimosum]KAJ5130999.1 hypothetical protein N7515_007038 [Penicillium bovifimosum]
MDHLPVEILQQICLNLEGPAYCPPKDLSSFSQINHLCNQAAVPILYRNITLILDTFQDLEAALSKVTEAPRASNFAKFARRLSLVCIELSGKSEFLEQAPPWTLEPWALNMATDPNPATRKGFLEHYMTSCYSTTGLDLLSSSHKSIGKTPNWAPIVSLIASLSHLDQFDFITANDFTADLTEAFWRYHPDCRLNILSEQQVGPSPLYPDTTSVSRDPVEFRMDTLQLPGLHTLTTAISNDYKQSAEHQQLWEMMPFLFTSPGLKHLCLKPADGVHEAGVALLKATWQSLIDKAKPKVISQLESVTIPGNRPEGIMLSRLAAAGDLSQLRSLDINCVCEPGKLVNVADLLPNLKRLFLDIGRRGPSRPASETDIEESMAGILAFRPLEYLYVSGLRDVETLDRIIQHHGPSLKGLALVPNKVYQYPRLNSSKLLEMMNLCPNMEELRLQMKRSAGNQAECEMYKALGTFPNLQRLFLDLDFDARPKVPRFGSVPETHDLDLRRTFINAAMDESLALQIWTTIKEKSPSLKDLRIFPCGNVDFPQEERYLLDCFARSYLLTGYNLENPGVPVMEQIGKREWEIIRARRNHWHESRDEEVRLSSRVVSVLRSIWPQVLEQTFRSEWLDCWTSLPLQPDTQSW